MSLRRPPSLPRAQCLPVGVPGAVRPALRAALVAILACVAITAADVARPAAAQRAARPSAAGDAARPVGALYDAEAGPRNPGGTTLQAPAPRAYEMVDLWPKKGPPAAGVIQRPVGLDIAFDGRVYVADAGAGGIHVMLPTGQFQTPIGAAGSDVERVAAPGKLAIDQAKQRIYVVDTGQDRIAVFDLEGKYLGQWPKILAGAVAVGPDSRVYVIDRERNAVRAFDGSGVALFDVGRLGTGDGEFTGLTDVSVSPDGGTLAVGDMHTLRVQIFDLFATGATHRRTYWLNAPKYGPPANGVPPWKQCRATVVNALNGDDVWVGDGTGACRLSPGGHTYTISSTAAGGAICKATVRLPRVRPATSQYVAFAIYDPNPGPCTSTRGGKRTELPTTPAVVTYADPDLLRPNGIFLATANASQDGGLVAPIHVSVPVPGVVFVQDSTRYGRYFVPDGTPLGTVALSTRQGLGASERYVIERAEGSDKTDEIFGYYRKEHRGRRPGGSDYSTPTPTSTAPPTGTPTAEVTQSPPAHGDVGAAWVEDEHGIGRFRATTVREQGQIVQVVEPVWTNPFELMSPERAAGRESPVDSMALVDLAYDHASGEVLALVARHSAKLRRDDARIERTRSDGVPIAGSWDLADDDSTSFTANPYIDMAVGPDGTILALNDYEDVAEALAADGTALTAVPVAADAVRVAGGTDSTVFALREPGVVEGYARDGTVAARFDGRPFASSDPADLSAIAADESGRVYTADALASVIAVFRPADPASGAQPAPADATCVLSGGKVADPVRLVLGDTTRVSLTIDGRCGVGETPSDIVLTVLYYPQLMWGSRYNLNGVNDDPAAPLIRELRQLVSRIDFGKHRVGIVSYWADTALELAPTSDRAKVLAAVQRISRKWPAAGNCEPRPRCWRPPCPQPDAVVCTSKPNVRDALQAAQAALGAPGDRRRAIVLYQPDYCNRDFEYRDGDCRGYVPAEDTAKAIRDSGTAIIVFDGNRSGYRLNRFNGLPYQSDAQPLASSDADSVLDYRDAQHRMVRYQVPEFLATGLQLSDTLPANMRLVPGSISPPATVTGVDVRWDVPQLGYRFAPFLLDVQPRQVGRWPTNVQAVASFTDGWGNAGQIVFPVPQVDVIAPTPTPEEATPTPEAVTPTTPVPSPTPTRPPWPSRLHLPIAVVNERAGAR